MRLCQSLVSTWQDRRKELARTLSGRICSMLAIGLLGGLCAPAQAQPSLSGSLDLAYGHDFGQDKAASRSHLNETLKGASPFSLVRARFFADGQISQKITAFTTLLFDEGVAHLDLEGAYLVFSELDGSPRVNLLVGKMPTAFGSFAARSFATANPLIGVPLIYHYFSAVRGTAVPRDIADQLSRRGADVYQSRGLPTLYDACWNTGVQLFGSAGSFTYALAITKGVLSNPSATDNHGFQWVGRLGVQPAIGLKLGLSAAQGPYLNAEAGKSPAFPQGRQVEDYAQRVVGLDAEYSLAHLELIAELVRNQWEVPNLAANSLGNTGGYLEGKYALAPGLYCALRYGRIDYDKIDDGTGTRVPWNFGVQRVETGLGYYLDRNTRLKAVVQLNFRDRPAAERSDHRLGVQLASTF
jgi:hypothetical protein